jgi:hypothetical protein
VLPSFVLAALERGWRMGLWVLAAILKHILDRRKRYPVLRLLIARPLWWLAAHALAVPGAEARYEEFRGKALARWKGYLLDSRPDRKDKSG